MGWIFLGNAVEFWWNPIILLTGDVSLRYLSELEIVSVNVREVIVAGWWCGWNCVRNSVVSEVLDVPKALLLIR